MNVCALSVNDVGNVELTFRRLYPIIIKVQLEALLHFASAIVVQVVVAQDIHLGSETVVTFMQGQDMMCCKNKARAIWKILGTQTEKDVRAKSTPQDKWNWE